MSQKALISLTANSRNSNKHLRGNANEQTKDFVELLVESEFGFCVMVIEKEKDLDSVLDPNACDSESKE